MCDYMTSEVERILNCKAIIKANNLSTTAFDNVWNYVTTIAHVYSDLYITAITWNYDIDDKFNNDVQECSDYIDKIIADHTDFYPSIGFMDTYELFTSLLEFVYGIADEYNNSPSNYVIAKVTEDILMKIIYQFEIEFAD